MQKIRTTIKQLILSVVLVAVTGLFMGCNTAHGFGKDVEQTGEKIQDKTQ